MPGNAVKGGPEELRDRVMSTGGCVSCGLCAALCPYIDYYGDRVRVIHSCGREQGKCFVGCPRVFLDPPALDREVFKQPRSDHELGIYQGIYYSRALGPFLAEGAQYGGTTTALLSLALKLDLVEAALAVKPGNGSGPLPALLRTSDEVAECAGSKYVAVPSLASLADARRQALNRVALAGRPCQVEAIRQWQMSGNEGRDWLPQVELAVGLFCFWSLEADFVNGLAKRLGGPLLRTDVPPEGMRVKTVKSDILIPLEEVRAYVKPACLACIDPTAEWADVSVGSTEADPGWNTLIVRTDRGQALVNAALDQGILELEPYPADRLPALRQAVRNKKIRALELLDEQRNALLQDGPLYRQAFTEGA